MNKKLLSATIVLVFVCSLAPVSTGSSNGIYSSASGCGSSYCHGGSGGATVSISGLPSSYTPGQSYTIQVAVSGGPSGSNGGFSLEVDKGQFSTGMGIMAVKVNSAGDSATHTTNSYRSWGLTWTAPSAGSGTANFGVAGNAVNGDGSATSLDDWDTATYQVPESGGSQPNNPPTVTNLQLSPTDPVTTDTLTLTYNYQDQDSDPESGTVIHWYRNSSHVAALDNSTTVSPSFTTKGDSWYAEVTPSDGEDQGVMETSPTLNVINSIPNVNSASILPNSATEDDNLSLSVTSSDADNDQNTISGIEWYLDGAKVAAFDNDEEIPSVAIRYGDVWYAKVKVNDGEVDSDWFTTLNVTIGSNNLAPTVTNVDVGGPYFTTDDLIATASATDPNNDDITLEWEWIGTTYTTDTVPSSATTKGESWKVKVRATDGALYSDWVESASIVIQNSPPVLNSLSIDQDVIYFQNEATYTFDAEDADGDNLVPIEVWSLDGSELTLILKVTDSDSSNSNELEDVVEIINSPPTVSYDGLSSQNALSDLSPFVTTNDAKGDAVTLNWTWMRNGFLTEFEVDTIPADRIAPGDTWVAMVTPNDGFEDGEVLAIEFTITNLPPTATITAPDLLVRGLMVEFSATDSTDLDGSIDNAIWKIDGVPVHQGLTYKFIMPESIILEVKVFDDLGESSISESTFSSQAPPLATNLEAVVDGTDVKLSWTGDAEMWAISHNGEVVGTTAEQKYSFSPSLSGSHQFNVYPIVDGQQITIDSVSSISSVELSAGSAPDTPGPSESAGMVVSIILILIGVAGVVSTSLFRRD